MVTQRFCFIYNQRQETKMNKKNGGRGAWPDKGNKRNGIKYRETIEYYST